MFDFQSCLSASQRHFLAAEFSFKPETSGMFNMSTDATGGKRLESAFIAYFNFWGEAVEQRGRNRAQSPCGCDEESSTCTERATSRVTVGGA